ncbi:hypothetical protein [Nonomuraea sp. NPDC048916]|uniref:hypothetical protein n=1 Tax=Nonomuraea sp. NPDC048916 TaxID=3154232 RepID=UPI0033D2219D
MRTVTIGLLAVVAVLGVVVGMMWFDLKAMRDADAAGVEAMAAARSMAPDLLSYDYRTIERDLARAAEHTTGSLTGHYRELSAALVTKAKAQKTVQTAAVTAVAVERAETDRVEVLLFVNTGTVKEVPGKAEPQQQISQNRARFVMVRQEARWLVADLSTLIGTA